MTCKSWRGMLEIRRPLAEAAWLGPIPPLALMLLLFLRLCLRRSWSSFLCLLFVRKQRRQWSSPHQTEGYTKGEPEWFTPKSHLKSLRLGCRFFFFFFSLPNQHFKWTEKWDPHRFVCRFDEGPIWIAPVGKIAGGNYVEPSYVSCSNLLPLYSPPRLRPTWPCWLGYSSFIFYFEMEILREI